MTHLNVAFPENHLRFTYSRKFNNGNVKKRLP